MTCAIKIDPSRLPVPRLEPTKPCRIDPKPTGITWETSLLNDSNKRKKRKCNPHEWTEEEMDMLVALYHQGVSYTEIAEKLGRSYKACSAKIKRLHETPRKPQ